MAYREDVDLAFLEKPEYCPGSNHGSPGRDDWGGKGSWATVGIAGAAYRVTVPAEVLIAALRQKFLATKMHEEIAFF